MKKSQGFRIYKYRGYLITPNMENGTWTIHSTYFGCDCETLSKCKKYVDSFLG